MIVKHWYKMLSLGWGDAEGDTKTSVQMFKIRNE